MGNDSVQEVKDRLDIVEIISAYLTVKKAGTNYKAVCPFHTEKTPSLMISPERQSFKCFGCSEGGDIITFIEKIEGLDFYNSLKLLAERAGIELKSNSVKFGDREHHADKKTKIFEINEWTKKVYQKILLDHPKAEKAREYLKKRGLSEKTIKEFEIGYAPNSWDFLLRFLRSKKYLDTEIVESGAAIRAEGGKIYDRFRGRIIFPINNAMGTTIAFTSRILEDDGKSAKYINSAESPIYTKGKTIYGLDKAKMAIKDAGIAVMVEGNMDVISCHQAGFNNVVATSGTALTLDQLKILTRYAPVIAFSFDSDTAGQTAMKRAIRMALQNDISIKIISTPAPFKDPDEAIKADPKNWEKAVEEAKPALEYWIDSYFVDGEQPSIEKKKMVAKEILPVIKIIYSEIEKEYYVRHLALRLSVSEKSLFEALSRAKTDREFTKEEKETAKKAKLSVIERIIGLLWSQPTLAKKFKVESAKLVCSDHQLAAFCSMLSGGEVDREKIKPEEALKLDQLAIASTEDMEEESEESVTLELSYLFGRLRSESTEKLKEEFALKIKQAEKTGDRSKLKDLLEEFSTLIK